MSLPSIRRPLPNVTAVRIGTLTVWFSYDTVVAFATGDDVLTVSQNVWSQTTGKHLNFIDGGSKEAKAERIPYDEFLSALRDVSDTTLIARTA